MFRELGHPAAFVYEALEHTRGRPERSFDLITRTGLSRTAVYEALETLAAWNLVEPRDGRWVLVPGTSLQLLAEQFGCATTPSAALLNRHRDERARYRRALRIVDQHHMTPALGGPTTVPVATRTTTPTTGRRPCSSCWNANSAPTPSPSARNHGQATTARHPQVGSAAGGTPPEPGRSCPMTETDGPDKGTARLEAVGDQCCRPARTWPVSELLLRSGSGGRRHDTESRFATGPCTWLGTR